MLLINCWISTVAYTADSNFGITIDLGFSSWWWFRIKFLMNTSAIRMSSNVYNYIISNMVFDRLSDQSLMQIISHCRKISLFCCDLYRGGGESNDNPSIHGSHTAIDRPQFRCNTMTTQEIPKVHLFPTGHFVLIIVIVIVIAFDPFRRLSTHSLCIFIGDPVNSNNSANCN